MLSLTINSRALFTFTAAVCRSNPHAVMILATNACPHTFVQHVYNQKRLAPFSVSLKLYLP